MQGKWSTYDRAWTLVWLVFLVLAIAFAIMQGPLQLIWYGTGLSTGIFLMHHTRGTAPEKEPK